MKSLKLFYHDFAKMYRTKSKYLCFTGEDHSNGYSCAGHHGQLVTQGPATSCVSEKTGMYWYFHLNSSQQTPQRQCVMLPAIRRFPVKY